MFGFIILKQTVEARWHLMSDGFIVANLVPLRAEPSESGSVKNYNHGQLYYIYDCVKCKKDKERNHGNYNCTRR